MAMLAIIAGTASAQRGGRGAGAPAGGGQGAAAALPEPNPQPYASVVTADSKSRAGMFGVHRIGARLLFEIPVRELNKDELVVMEISKNAAGSGAYGGQAVGNHVLRWERRDNRVYLRQFSYATIADSTQPEYRAMADANTPAIIGVYNVEAYGADSSAVIDVSRTFVTPPPELGPGNGVQGTVDANRSWIERAAPFPDNVNVYATLTFTANAAAAATAAGGAGGRGGRGGGTTSTIVMSWSFNRLPDKPMTPRYCDDRVGYFTTTTTDFSDRNDKVTTTCYITRYRLEKKNPNAAVSDPIKPIVYYIDPATPTKWVPWLKKAVEDWQPAFLAAGFSHAIIAKEAPKNDPDWSPEDARISVIRWLPSTTENASGPHVSDPRSGEILEAHIQAYQNVQHLALSWYFTQASAVDPRARMFPYPDSLMGRLLEYVFAHEVGHTLGFQHNMKSSAEYPVDSLRSPTWLHKMGHVATLMDYSRFNYLVQPEDKLISMEDLLPRIGPYDLWATHWGYAPIPGAKTPEAERSTLDAWAREQDKTPWFRFSTAGHGTSDPGDETEAVGDQDAVKATGWGIKNIQREMAYLMPATVKPTENYADLDELYGRLVSQWRTELTHVTNIIGGAESQDKYGSQQGVQYTPLSKARQRTAVQFLSDNAFQTPKFFLDENILRRVESEGAVARISTAQSAILNSLLGGGGGRGGGGGGGGAGANPYGKLDRMAEYEAFAAAGSAYSVHEFFAEVRHGVFTELPTADKIDAYRRALQRAYIDNMNTKLNPPPPDAAAAAPAGRGGGGGRGAAPALNPKYSDVPALARNELQELDGEIRLAIPKVTDKLTRVHLDDLRVRISDALKGKLVTTGAVPEPPIPFGGSSALRR